MSMGSWVGMCGPLLSKYDLLLSNCGLPLSKTGGIRPSIVWMRLVAWRLNLSISSSPVSILIGVRVPEDGSSELSCD